MRNICRKQCSLHFAAMTSLLVALLGCGQDEAGSELVMPGQTTTAVGNLRYHHTGFDGSGSLGVEVTTCSMARNIGSAAILQDTGEKRVVYLRPDCSGPYATTAVLHDMDVLAVAAGSALPRRITVVSLASFVKVPDEGDTVLATLRNADGEWFVSTNLPLEVNAEGDLTPVTGPDVTVSLPQTFSRLHMELAAAHSDLRGQCPDEAEKRLSDADYASQAKVPTERDCEPETGVDQPCTDPDCSDYVAPPCEDDRFCDE